MRSLKTILDAIPARAALVVLLAVAGSPLACSRSAEPTAEASTGETETDGEDGAKKDKETPIPIEITSLARGEIESILHFSTNLIAEDEVQVHAQAARLVRELLVEEGDRVTAGQTLLRLQDDEQRSALAKAQAQYDRAERGQLRNQQLFERELVSQQTFSDVTFDYEQRKIALEDAQREIGYTEVVAPIAGTITRRMIQVGDQITVGQHLFDVVDFDSLAAPVYVPEKELARIRVGLEARVQSQATGASQFAGRIERIAPIVDPKSGTVKVLVALDDRNGLRPGMYVEVSIVADVHRDALLVPKRSLVYDRDQMFVYRLKEDERRVERIPLVPILADKESVEPAGGLDEGDQIVIAGQAGLKDGALVRLPGDPIPEDDEDEA